MIYIKGPFLSIWSVPKIAYGTGVPPWLLFCHFWYCQGLCFHLSNFEINCECKKIGKHGKHTLVKETSFDLIEVLLWTIKYLESHPDTIDRNSDEGFVKITLKNKTWFWHNYWQRLCQTPTIEKEKIPFSMRLVGSPPNTPSLGSYIFLPHCTMCSL